MPAGSLCRRNRQPPTYDPVTPLLVALFALIPAASTWWFGQTLIALADDPALPERLMAGRGKTVLICAVSLALLFIMLSNHFPATYASPLSRCVERWRLSVIFHPAHCRRIRILGRAQPDAGRCRPRRFARLDRRRPGRGRPRRVERRVRPRVQRDHARQGGDRPPRSGPIRLAGAAMRSAQRRPRTGRHARRRVRQCGGAAFDHASPGADDQ